ncbi:unnamed protein product, partial [Brenthis ino]
MKETQRNNTFILYVTQLSIGNSIPQACGIEVISPAGLVLVGLQKNHAYVVSSYVHEFMRCKIRALVPVEHAQSNNSDKSENNSDYELPPPSPSTVSSSRPSINSCLERLDLNNSP